MSEQIKNVVTGSLGYIGKYITKELLRNGQQVKTITTHVNKPNPFGLQVTVYPYSFKDPKKLVSVLHGADVLYNTYWIRYEYKNQSFKQALAQTKILFDCAKKAGVKKIVHISVTKADQAPELAYYNGKTVQEQYVKESGIPYVIVRPSIVFGQEEILLNNIAYLLRKFPVFPIFGKGDYLVQPVSVLDLARISVESAKNKENVIIDAIGPETYKFKDLVAKIRDCVSPKTILMPMPVLLGVFLGKLVGCVLKDNLLTKEEALGLMKSLLVSNQEPNGTVSFLAWLSQNKETMGLKYHSELKRHYLY